MVNSGLDSVLIKKMFKKNFLSRPVPLSSVKKTLNNHGKVLEKDLKKFCKFLEFDFAVSVATLVAETKRVNKGVLFKTTLIVLLILSGFNLKSGPWLCCCVLG